MLAEVKQGKLSVAAAGRLLGICHRQAKRIWRRFKKKGDAGLMHRNRGKPGPRRKSAKLRAQVLARYRERYPDFGPTLTAEKLQTEGLAVDHETLRRWLVASALADRIWRRAEVVSTRTSKPTRGGACAPRSAIPTISGTFILKIGRNNFTLAPPM